MIGMHGSFKSDKSTLELSVIRTNEDLLRVGISTPGVETYGSIDLAPSDAPALALAILEAAGRTDSSKGGIIDKVSNAMLLLKEHVKAEERNTLEAKEQAELEGEALELFNANQGTDLDDWKYADRSVVSSWVRVARKAREIGAEK